MQYSILDLATVTEGQTPTQAIGNTVALAQHAESLGYNRYWLAEHHNMAGIASAATSVLIGHVAGQTARIRVGAGGVMLPNHAPLAIAEQFGTLDALYPGRIDLGLGRAPGGDHAVMRAMRAGARGDSFPQDVVELMGYLDDPDPAAAVQAHPGQGSHVPVWMLGSSLFGAQLAAYLGLPYAFASHFAPDALDDAIATYRSQFRPSKHLDKPYFMLAVNVFAADTDTQAAFLRTSQQQAFARLRSGQPGKLPPPVQDIDGTIGAGVRQAVDHALRVTAVGSQATVRGQLADMIARYTPDEVILTGQMFDQDARHRSFTLAAEVLSDLPMAA
ncbi:LLM class flavin-dependent oxidoreductase [Loktanella sp. SALINAS62]|uniref:LLM class flavin-dependent oxidoreductase n=1 Tax=Loktanella sp. SALINAS62 TaxID=2706124 RepID=UPI001B8C5815|nr:LLM class flavin-dependent oxidoreductase [Loktanella sp. SALINAS62]MBS1304054.1 LLM class flavin-dependent oxidoreductase [Loktanella sp. SALINAS62]